MPKSSFFTGQPVFNQILSLIPRSMVNELSRKYQSDRYCKRFRSYDHLVTMLYSTLHRCTSLREVISGMQASSQRLRHLGLNAMPRRSTLADANERRSSTFFEDIYHGIYHRYYGSLPDSLKGKKLSDKLFIMDSSIVTLFSTIMQSTGSFGLNGKKKGGIKAHMLVRAKDNLPCFVRLTEGKQSDSKFMVNLSLPTGSIIVMDKGYRNYQQLIQWTTDSVSWVSRLHGRSVYKIKSARSLTDCQINQGVLHDYEVDLGNPKSKNPIQQARLIRYQDRQSGRCFEFITNNLSYAPATIARIYKQRWQIELLFKRVKQNFQLHYFLGDNQNAIQIQLWSALIADLLLKIIKDKADRKRKWSMANLAGLVRLHLGTYINLFYFLAEPDKALLNYIDPVDKAQLTLFPQQNRGA